MKWLGIVSLAFVVAILQISLLGAWRINGAVLNVSLVLVLVLAMRRLASEAILAALVSGLVLDAASGGQFGLATSSLLCIALFAAVVRQLGVQGDHWPVRVGLTALATTFWGSVHIISIGFGSMLMFSSWSVVVIEIVLNSGLAVLVWRGGSSGARTI